MSRFEDWPVRLDAHLDSMRLLNFEWGVRDCVLFAASAVLAMTGEDLVPEFRGRYASKAEAYTLIKASGETLAACVDLRLPPIAVKLAGRGDIVMWQGALGVCTGLSSFFMTEKNGLQGIPTRKCEAAWRVE